MNKFSKKGDKQTEKKTNEQMIEQMDGRRTNGVTWSLLELRLAAKN